MSIAILRGATIAIWKLLWTFDKEHPDRHLCDRITRMEVTLGEPGNDAIKVQVGLTGPSARDLTDLTLLTLPAALQDSWELKRVVALDGHTVQFTLV